MLELFDHLRDNGLRMTWMAHFSTPRELLNPSTIAAVRRLQAHGVDVRSQSPIMNHISLFTDAQGTVDVDRSAQNWIDLGNLLGHARHQLPLDVLRAGHRRAPLLHRAAGRHQPHLQQGLPLAGRRSTGRRATSP